jgi:hypothetical protein
LSAGAEVPKKIGHRAELAAIVVAHNMFQDAAGVAETIVFL